MNINWHIVNEVAQWLVLARIWVAICSNNTKITNTFSKINRNFDQFRKF